jgi:O-acetyl-ADP-ribose deacetylase (regulator of RNase III)
MIEIVRADITTLGVDAIVNAANEALAPGGGVCGAIYRAAGPKLVEATSAIGGCATGDAVLTPGFSLPARFVIHAVGPIWHGGRAREAELLRQTYDSAFRVARDEPTIRSIAFPAISTGIYGFPKQLAADIAVRAMRDHERAFDRIVACLFDAESEETYAAAQRARR